MQYTKVVTICDKEWQDENREVEAEEYITYVLVKPMSVHLCPPHIEEIETKMSQVEIREFVNHYGRPYKEGGITSATKPKSKKKSPVQVVAESEEEFKCRWCDRISPTPQGRGAHESAKHPAEFEAAGGTVKGRKG